jgi:predicted ATP-grasp superfamily ATP-dependent carboligase
MKADRNLNVLVIGQNVRHIATSAARAGLVVSAADCYSDLDLAESVSQYFPLEADPSTPGDLVRAAEDLMRGDLDLDTVDFIVLGPGVEEMRIEEVRVLNNPPERISTVSDKLWLSRWLEREGFATVPTRPLAADLDPWGYPLMVKPRKGAGGAENRLVTSDEDLAGLNGDLIVQKMVEGTPASVSVIADGKEAVAISANEQLIGTDWLGGSGYRYCGNISPLDLAPDDDALAEMVKVAEEIAVGLGLVGSNGIDFILAESGPVVLEVNPRFQGSLDAVELSTGMNLFLAHLQSFDGYLPERPKPRGFGGRGVLFAKDDLKIGADLRGVSRWITDVPRPGSFAKRSDPVTSIISFGENRKWAVNLLLSRSSAIYRACRLWRI